MQLGFLSGAVYAQNPPSNPYYGSTALYPKYNGIIQYIPSTYTGCSVISTNPCNPSIRAMGPYDKSCNPKSSNYILKQSPTIDMWVSLSGEPTETSDPLPYGSTASISLQLNYAYMFCHTETGNTYFPYNYNRSYSSPPSPPDSLWYTGLYVQNITANEGTVDNASGITINIPTLDSKYSYYPKYGFMYSTPFIYNPPSGGVTTDITLQATLYAFNDFNNNGYTCVVSSDATPPGPYSSINGLVQANPPPPLGSGCPQYRVFPIATVGPPPSISLQSNLVCSLNLGSNTASYTINNFSPTTEIIEYYYTYTNFFSSGGPSYTKGPLQPNGSSGGTTVSGTIFLPTIPGQYSATIEVVSKSDGAVFASQFLGSDICSDYPYFQVNGSDTQVGLGFCPAPSLSLLGLSDYSNANIKAWNHNQNSTASFLNNNYSQGAGDQYGSIATGSMIGFDSANINNGTNPLGLSFSNINNSPSFDYSPWGFFGGSFASLPSCGNNYFNNITDQYLQSLPQPQLSRLNPGSGIQVNYHVGSSVPQSGTYLLGPINLFDGSNVTIYVQNENVQINKDIILNNSGNSTNISLLSSFKLIVLGGNIIISPGVNKVDGVYVAEPDSTGGGTINTCGTLPSPTSKCSNQLIVNGSLVANSIRLWRTGGTVNGSPAETINQPPSEWLSSLNIPGPLTMNSIQSLPPVL